MFERIMRLLRRLGTPECRVIRRDGAARIPTAGTAQAAGYDLTSIEDVTVAARGRALVHTGLLVAPPAGHHIEIRPRSGLALRHGITVLNSPGTVDADYRGELMVILLNTSDEDFEVHAGDRIAQAVFMRHESVRWTEVEAFDETPRGARGFGSTGVEGR